MNFLAELTLIDKSFTCAEVNYLKMRRNVSGFTFIRLWNLVLVNFTDDMVLSLNAIVDPRVLYVVIGRRMFAQFCVKHHVVWFEV